jgi:signal transduction histidine kinase/ActR/RegA family two-component response regulator
VTRVAIRDYFAHTLTGKALLRLALLGAAVLVLFGAIGAAVLYRQITAQESERLALLAAERARVAEQVLGHVAEMHRTVRDEFVRRWPDYRNAATARRFESLLERDAEGAWRSRTEISDGRLFPTGWVRKGTPLTDEVRERVVLFHDLSRRFGPGAATRNDNLYFVGMPEQSNMGYDPTLSPTWSNDVPSDFDQLGTQWGRLAYESVPPGASTRWSTPEIDDVSPALGPVFAVLTPIHVDGQQLATVGTTIVVKEFLNRVLPTLGAQARYVAIHADGRPLTDTRPGVVSGAPLGDLHARLGAITAGGAASYAGYSDADDMLYALARIDGPGWYVAAMLPGAELRSRAAAPLLWTLGFGACALLLPLAIVSAILRRQVAAPLGDLTHAAESLAAGDTTVRLPATRDDELGRLSIAFNDMAAKVAERDRALREDKRQLEAALHSLVEAQNELARQRDALHQSEKLSAFGSLLAGVAHELNNPLAVVVGRAFQLEEAATHPIDRERATQLRIAAERCARIVRTFLAMARRQEATRAPVRVEQVVRDALALLGYVLQTNDVQVMTEFDAALPPVHADADQLSQVLLNLITNAQQAMAQVSGPRQLTVRTHRSNDARQVIVDVVDTGPGVPADLAGRIFDPYFTTKPVGEGTGVGLAVSLGIVQAHGGTLALEPPAGGGAHFVVTLPAAEGDAADHDPLDAFDASGPHDDLCILVVDDEASIADWLRDTLEGAGHGVAVAHDGVQALRYLEDQAFDLVLTDMKMPQMDGSALIRELLARHPYLAGRVIAMTGDSLSQGVREFVREHALPMLRKPFEPRELWAALRRVHDNVRK